jgi:hypothetical protein
LFCASVATPFPFKMVVDGFFKLYVTDSDMECGMHT